jgi:blue copper oxidase
MAPPTNIGDLGDRLTRSGFVRAGVLSVATLSAGGAASLAPLRARGAAPPKGTATRYPLNVPPTTSPAGLTLAEAPAVVDLGGGQYSNVLAYNGFFPGPSIVAQRGDSASIKLVNGLAKETITHWHGMIVDERNDGGPKYAVPPGSTYDYAFTINQRACLNWYHPHPHMLTGEQVNLGLAGAFIVRDNVEAALGLPYGAHEVPLIIRDATLDQTGNLAYKPRTGGFDGQIPLVNGTHSPYLAVDSGLYRFRVLNGANARIFGLALSNGAPFTLIGNDGGFLESQATLSRIDIAPAERLDLLLDFSNLRVGQSVMLRDLRAGWDLVEFRVVAPGTGTVPTLALPSISKLSNPVTTRTFSFDGMSKINGQLYDMNRIDFQVPFGQTERWRFMTNGNAPHPVHVHGASFQVQSRTGGRGTIFPWEQGWKDTVLLEDNETVDVLVRFDAFRGKYLIHCHKLEHEDMGMMANFEVV